MDYNQEVFWLTVALSTATVLGIFYLLKAAAAHYLRFWHQHASQENWRGVESLMNDDPLDFSKKFPLFWDRVRWPGTKRLLGDIVLLAFLGSLWGCVYSAVQTLSNCTDPYLYFQLIDWQRSKSQAGGTALLIGFCTLAATLIGIFYQWRVKARSENRQKWIDDIRALLADIIADMPTPSESYEVREKKKKEYLPKGTKLELLLNPSERVHRALIALLRHAYGFDDVPIDKIPREQLGINLTRPDIRHEFIDLKSQIIRLSNVALKREWEQVKHAR